MPLIYNISGFALSLDTGAPGAVQPGGSAEVDEDRAVALCETPEWSLTPPANEVERPAKASRTQPAEEAQPSEETL